MPPSKFIGIGNPLLDFIVYVKDDELFSKYKLKPDDAILADKEHMPIYEELVNNYKVTYVSGGAGLNTVKMIQWLSEKEGEVSYFGSIGDDETGKRLVSDCKQLGVDTEMIVDKDLSTGKCAVIVKDVDRSMVTHLGASVGFNKQRLTSQLWDKIQTGKIFYMCAYFVNTSMDITLDVAKMASAIDDKIYAFNLSAPFLSMFFCDKINQILPYVSILFGNASEISAYAKTNNLKDDIKTVARYLHSYKKENEKKDRMVIVTNGSKEIFLINKDGEFDFPVEDLDQNEIVDSNGAGDAFAGGFLKEYGQGNDIKTCIETAKKAARYILKQSGFQLGDKKDF